MIEKDYEVPLKNPYPEEVLNFLAKAVGRGEMELRDGNVVQIIGGVVRDGKLFVKLNHDEAVDGRFTVSINMVARINLIEKKGRIILPGDES